MLASVDTDLGPVSDLSPFTVVLPGYPFPVRLGSGWRKSSTPSAASSLLNNPLNLTQQPSHPAQFASLPLLSWPSKLF